MHKVFDVFEFQVSEYYHYSDTIESTFFVWSDVYCKDPQVTHRIIFKHIYRHKIL